MWFWDICLLSRLFGLEAPKGERREQRDFPELRKTGIGEVRGDSFLGLEYSLGGLQWTNFFFFFTVFVSVNDRGGFGRIWLDTHKLWLAGQSQSINHIFETLTKEIYGTSIWTNRKGDQFKLSWVSTQFIFQSIFP